MTDLTFPESLREMIITQSKKTYKPHTRYKVYLENNIKSENLINLEELLSIIRMKVRNKYIYKFGHKNFYVITRYNRSRLYALAVFHLAEELRESKSSK